MKAMRSIKKNFLKPLLFVGLGLTIATIAFAGVRMVFDPPSPPGRPEATSIWADRCTLSYLPPSSDGGSRVSAYIIVGRSILSSRWTVKGSISGLEFTVRNGIVKGSTHEFRVSAQNAAGLGEASKVSNPVTFDNPY